VERIYVYTTKENPKGYMSKPGNYPNKQNKKRMTTSQAAYIEGLKVDRKKVRKDVIYTTQPKKKKKKEDEKQIYCLNKR
jgi:hypothetical protein